MHHEESTNREWELHRRMDAKREVSDNGKEILMSCVNLTLVQG